MRTVDHVNRSPRLRASRRSCAASGVTTAGVSLLLRIGAWRTTASRTPPRALARKVRHLRSGASLRARDREPSRRRGGVSARNRSRSCAGSA